MKRESWIRLGVALLVVLLLWWLYMAMLVNEDEGLAVVRMMQNTSSLMREVNI